mmetsp:Transcript_16602/g.50275  ORF Transcript_16602/g.50275 Transcript_16602/m.50275 type:complete len:244 (-) Transcript_16602:92-823(-)
MARDRLRFLGSRWSWWTCSRRSWTRRACRTRPASTGSTTACLSKDTSRRWQPVRRRTRRGCRSCRSGRRSRSRYCRSVLRSSRCRGTVRGGRGNGPLTPSSATPRDLAIIATSRGWPTTKRSIRSTGPASRSQKSSTTIDGRPSSTRTIGTCSISSMPTPSVRKTRTSEGNSPARHSSRARSATSRTTTSRNSAPAPGPARPTPTASTPSASSTLTSAPTPAFRPASTAPTTDSPPSTPASPT